jgi:hypothetical protein
MDTCLSLFLLLGDFRWKDMKVRWLSRTRHKTGMLTILIDAHHHRCCNRSHSSHHHRVHRSCDKPLVVDSHSTTVYLPGLSRTVSPRSRLPHLRRVVVSMRFYNSLSTPSMIVRSEGYVKTSWLFTYGSLLGFEVGTFFLFDV